uniref:Protein Dr1 n=1 Tax=Hippocampus comes TaxID=109280 RepID=A0A3Q3D7F2_HIPCM
MASSSGNDDDLTIPRAAINKMIKETLPNVRVANDARELVVNCCTEFIHLISSEANEICNKSDKKTISPEHVINGEGTSEVAWLCKPVALRKASSRLENLGIPEEELLRQQQELFAKVSPTASGEGGGRGATLSLQAASSQTRAGPLLRALAACIKLSPPPLRSRAAAHTRRHARPVPVPA